MPEQQHHAQERDREHAEALRPGGARGAGARAGARARVLGRRALIVFMLQWRLQVKGVEEAEPDEVEKLNNDAFKKLDAQLSP